MTTFSSTNFLQIMTINHCNVCLVLYIQILNWQYNHAFTSCMLTHKMTHRLDVHCHSVQSVVSAFTARYTFLWFLGYSSVWLCRFYMVWNSWQLKFSRLSSN